MTPNRLHKFGSAACSLYLLCTAFILLATVPLQAATNDVNSVLFKVISIEFKEDPLPQAIEKIEQKTNVEFVYVSNILNKDITINGSYQNIALHSLLKIILKNTDIHFVEEYNRVVLKKKKDKISNPLSTPSAQKIELATLPQLSVSGTVLDASSGIPMLGVVILEKGTTNGTTTDFDGNYTISVSRSDATLEFSYVGFVKQEIKVNGRTTLNVSLLVDVVKMDEVVVMGYGTQKKSNVIGSIASLKSEDLNFKSAVSVESGLQGLTSGVSVQTQGGSPGAPTVIRIRGVNSINANTNPLWVIDGMITERNPAGVGSANQSPLSLINEADIESIEVLKDAAATAIYGSRGSSGVIIVTTKKGKGEQLQTNVNYTTGISELTRTPQDLGYANTKTWLDIQDVAHQNSFGRNFFTDDHFLRSPNAVVRLDREEIDTVNTNWTDQIFRSGIFHQINVSSSKGFKGGNFYISTSYRNEEGVQKFNDFERLTVTANTTITPLKNLQWSLRANLARTENERRNRGTTSIISFALPWFPVQDPTNPERYFNPQTGANPTALVDPDNRRNNVEQYRALIGTSLEYKLPFIKGLSIRSEFSADIIQSNIIEWISGDVQFLGNRESLASAREEAVTFRSNIFNVYGSYNKDFGKHFINLVAGYETQDTETYAKTLEGFDLNGTFQQIGSPNQIERVFGGLTNERYLRAYFGRVNYTYDDRYLLGFSARRDGSSNFTEKNRWGNFLAYSAGWNISNEKFFGDFGINNSLKLRASYGETGNQDIPPGLDSPLYSPGGVTFGNIGIGGVNGTLRTNIPNEDLRWETTQSFNAGFDLAFSNNRFSISADYYRKVVEDLLLLVPLPLSTGISSDNTDIFTQADDITSNQIFSNVGDMSNTGFEFEVRSVNISKPNFSWRTNFNISFNETKVERLADFIDSNGQGLQDDNFPLRSRTGFRRAVWFVSDWAGVDSETGVPQIYAMDQELFAETGDTRRLLDESGNPVLLPATNTNVQDNPFYQDNKSIDPTYYGGITNSFTYKNFDLSFLFSFSGGNYILDYDRQISTIPNVTRNILSEVLEESWQQPGDIARYPEIRARGEFVVDGSSTRGFDGTNAFHNRELYKGDFIRLRNVTFGFNLPKEVVNKFQLNNLRLYAQANNMWTITDFPGFDPEGATFINQNLESRIPQTKSIIFGLNLQF
ncbi:MAG: SusC/RagA family TonB-linked outer membrane protein [Bacteroidota bacterium]